MKRLSTSMILLLVMAVAAFAQPFSVSFNTFNGTTFDPLVIMNGATAVPVGNFIQVIKTGANGVADAANATTGALGGDDILATTTSMGEGTLMDGTFSFSVTCYTTAERPNTSFPSPGETIYIRVWTTTTVPVVGSASYAQTGLFTVPASFSDVFDVQVSPNSATPNWVLVGAPPSAPIFGVTGYSNGGTAMFGNVYTGSSSSMDFTITNTGNADLVVGAPSVSGDFSTTYAGGTIAASGNATCTVVFTPSTAGLRTSTLSFTHNATGSPFSLNLEGTGVSPYAGGNTVTPPANTGNPGDPWSPTFPSDPGTGGNPPCGMNFGNSGTNPTNVSVQLTNTLPGAIPGAYLPAGNTIQRYWTITHTGGSGWSVQLHLRFTEADIMSVFGVGDPNLVVPQIVAGRFDATTGALLGWYYVTFSLVSGTTPNRIWDAAIDGVTGFSIWGLGNGGQLPVTGMTVSAAAGDGKVVLSWTVASEINNSHFLVKRSTGGDFVTVGRINSRTNNSAEPVSYSFEDVAVSNNMAYSYKIVDVGLDGLEHGSSMVVSATPNAPVVTEYTLSNYPNPFNPETRINFALREAGAVKLTVTNVMGQTVATLINGKQMAKGNHTISWNAGSMPSGIYFVRYEVNGFSTMRKMVLSK